MKRQTVILIFISIGLVVSFAAFPFFKKPSESNYIERIGVIEATEVNLSSKIAERIIDLPFNEGDTIAANSVAVHLDAKEVEAEVAQAEANVQRGEANILNAKAQVEKAEANLQDAKINLNRISQLRDEGLISPSEIDRAQTKFNLAEAELKAAEAELRSARAELKQRKANLHLTEIRLKETLIYAPISGVVSLKAFEVGEMVSPGITILTLINPESVWARINLEEGDIGKIRLGSRSEIWVDAVPGRPFEGKVTEVGAEGGFATQRDATRGRQDIKTFRVKIHASSPEGLLKPGMTAKVKIYFDDIQSVHGK